jgi:deoxyadenosine/deoxycytidine kinase
METMNSKPLYLSIMGTLGCGKTTVARLIAKKFRFHLVEENFGENAFLPRFYKNMKRWAFHSQTFFLMEKMTQLMEIGKERQKMSIVQDTPIEQDVYSYAKAQHMLGNMDDSEWRLYLKIYTSFEPYLPKPDIIIYLETSIPEIQKRITSRGRGYEKNIPKKYLELLDRLNHEWLRENKIIKVLTIRTDGLNIVTSEIAQKRFLKQLRYVFREKK